MKKVNQTDFAQAIKENSKVVVMLSRESCYMCNHLKSNVIPKLQEELKLPFIEIEAIADVYPVNELSKKFGFKTVPVIAVYSDGEPKQAITKDFTTENIIKNIQSI
ncbi:MAG: thioredoxin family protein [Tenacibaculum sp.]|nr:thioredoxin family protein [Tenacibaculum sp.]